MNRFHKSGPASLLTSTLGSPPLAEPLDTRKGVHAVSSDAPVDLRWDEFLVSTPLGQFQQSSAWGRVKQLEGWKAARTLVTADGAVAAGFQILWKSRFGVRFGYVSKGPVNPPSSGLTGHEIVMLLQRATARLGLQALIVQPPDYDRDLESHLRAAGFLPNPLGEVFSATVAVDIGRPFGEVERRFSHDVARQIRLQINRHVQVRTGTLADADAFFALMKQSSARQGASPNPSNPRGVAAILREFQSLPSRDTDPLARCFFADCDGRTLAGILLIRFGERLSVWKKGAADNIGRVQPNRLLDRHAMKWGSELGCSSYDLVGFDRSAAEEILAGRPSEAVQMKSSDRYKLHFGGTPVLFPRALIWAPGSFRRLTLRLISTIRTDRTAMPA